ncbi:dioxygenase [Acinetobacter gerneri]|uniref:Dioxygenase n=1 Tax=Acinetobacter gerneri TaxID=202952 RepID=A0AAW8JGH1_9GAMM|nr:dioxygenase [Acinetobacter gerneri]MDQ9008696.1 dioxygenase [Acinetobacter gerneri]MDQ9012756.1 dioxygenase [Acinetobacter gerneri]MDQ9024235.1 dioxygenase [Acinetobacter gerneri]MDQ9051472.1 dioxygenase [Acinetobacter gerneri]MDQ9058695.1 dioxygenase [Acinetobacter gerneri]
MHDVTTSAIKSFENISDARPKMLIQKLVKAIHEYIDDVELTQQEWEMAIDFLTRTGQLCHEQRQEYILLSDVLGVSMLVDEINHSKNHEQTPSTVFGPFFIANMPVRHYADSIIEEKVGDEMPLLVKGKIFNQQGEVIKNAKIEVWQTAENGMYSGQDPDQPVANLRGAFMSQENGEYAFKSILPVSYQIPSDGTVGELLNYSKRHFWRPAHIHFMIIAEGYHPLVTHLFIQNDEYLQGDAVFGVKDRLIVGFEQKQADQTSKQQFGLDESFNLIEYDFVLSKGE